MCTNMDKAEKVNRKRLYIGLSLAALGSMLGALGGTWYLFTHQDYYWYRVVLMAVVGFFLFVLALAGFGTAALIFSILRREELASLKGLIRMATDFLFPVAVFLGRLLGIAKEKIWASYIEVNNVLVGISRKSKKLERIIILAPHCLQDSVCTRRVTHDPENCVRCGKCDIAGLLEVAQKYGAVLKVATGGTIARKYLKEIRPQGVVAIACERDLSLGIQDSKVLPVIGVLNQRPYGPCQDTKVDIRKVEEALRIIKG